MAEDSTAGVSMVADSTVADSTVAAFTVVASVAVGSTGASAVAAFTVVEAFTAADFMVDLVAEAFVVVMTEDGRVVAMEAASGEVTVTAGMVATVAAFAAVMAAGDMDMVGISTTGMTLASASAWVGGPGPTRLIGPMVITGRLDIPTMPTTTRTIRIIPATRMVPTLAIRPGTAQIMIRLIRRRLDPILPRIRKGGDHRQRQALL